MCMRSARNRLKNTKGSPDDDPGMPFLRGSVVSDIRGSRNVATFQRLCEGGAAPPHGTVLSASRMGMPVLFPSATGTVREPRADLRRLFVLLFLFRFLA